MTPPSEPLVVAPVLLPLATAALLLGLGGRRRRLRALLGIGSAVLGLTLVAALALRLHAEPLPLAYAVHLPGNWPAPFGIVLVADHLSALMALLAGSVGLAALLFALARWQHAGVHFHPLFQLQLAGLYGAFLTGDLFNLFVFFEVLLAASYALLLHAGGLARVRAGLHYIAVNLAASLLFLVGVAVLYGVTGTLNMADIARVLPSVPAGDRGLLHAGAAILAVAFLAKAAAWPLGWWLPAAYSAASAPAAALFTILTKVGLYALLRLWTLWFAPAAGASAGFGGVALVWAGLVTLGFAALGMLASQQLGRLAAYGVVASSGTVLAALGFGAPALTGGALYYLASSTLAACLLFLLVEPLERARQVELGPQDFDDGHAALPAFFDARPAPSINLDDDEQALIGRAFPAALAFLGIAFVVCALVVAGLPPLSGFVGKLALLQALLPLATPAAAVMFVLLLGSGLLAALALVRAGMRHFWSAGERPPPQLRLVEGTPIAALALVLLALAAQGGPLLDYTRASADALHEPARYIEAVLGARPRERAAEPVSR